MLKQVILVCMVVLVSTATAFAVITPTDTCTGPPVQPTGTSTDMGDQQISPAIPAGATDLLAIAGTGCFDQAGPDSVWCFVPTTTCMAAFELVPAGTDMAALSVIDWGTSGSCGNSVSDCTSLGSAGGGVGVNVMVGTTASPVTLTAGNTICVYGSVSGSAPSGVYNTNGLAGCGALPVKVQSFTVKSEKAEPAAESDTER